MATSTAAAVDMEDIQTVDLMSELLRRMKCASKPDKRLVFIGKLSIILPFVTSEFSQVFRLDLWELFAKLALFINLLI